MRKPQGGRGSKSANVGANKNDVANLRDHDTITNFCTLCGAWYGELGLEPDFRLYVDHLIQIFAEVKRVLKATGTCWVNIGDSYAGSGKGPGGKTSQIGNVTKAQEMNRHQVKIDIPSKSLVAIPARFQLAMIDAGWICRNKIIWYKRNCMPSSAKDRFTVDYELLFFFVKEQKYYFEQQLEPHKAPMGIPRQFAKKGNRDRNDTGRIYNPLSDTNSQGRNKRCVWDIPTKPSSAKDASDYVGLDGKLYIASLNCPFYEHRLLAQKRERGERGALIDFQKLRNQDNGPYLFAELNGESSSIPDHNDDSNKVSGKNHVQNVHNTVLNKTSALPLCDKDRPQIAHRNTNTESESFCNCDCFPLSNDGIAIERSKKSRKNDDVTNSSCIVCGKKISRNARTAKQLDAVVMQNDTHASNIEEDSFSCVKVKHPSGQKTSDNIRTYISYNKDNMHECQCQENKGEHFAAFPDALVKTPIEAGCPPGGVVLDPFCGTGTTCEMAKKLGRQFIGIDLQPDYIKQAERNVGEILL